MVFPLLRRDEAALCVRWKIPITPPVFAQTSLTSSRTYTNTRIIISMSIMTVITALSRRSEQLAAVRVVCRVCMCVCVFAWRRLGTKEMRERVTVRCERRERARVCAVARLECGVTQPRER